MTRCGTLSYVVAFRPQVPPPLGLRQYLPRNPSNFVWFALRFPKP